VYFLFLSVLVQIGGILGVTLGIEEYQRLQTYSQPNKFTLALAEKLYGMEGIPTNNLTHKLHLQLK